jgi:hypothetical protein
MLFMNELTDRNTSTTYVTRGRAERRRQQQSLTRVGPSAPFSQLWSRSLTLIRPAFRARSTVMAACHRDSRSAIARGAAWESYRDDGP